MTFGMASEMFSLPFHEHLPRTWDWTPWKKQRGTQSPAQTQREEKTTTKRPP